MSISMIHTITFTKWFLNKLRANGLIVDGNDFDLILSQLDQSTWDEFVATSGTIISKTTVDTLIPQLVEKITKKPRNQKNADDKPKGKKMKVDAQTETENFAQPPANVEEPVKEDPPNVEPVKEVKKRVSKAKKPLEKLEVVQQVNVEEPVNEEQVNEEPVKEVKKRVSKAKKPVEKLEVVQQVNVEEPVNEEPVKEVKKRVSKAKKPVEKQVNVEEPVNEVTNSSDEKIVKIRNKKTSIVVPDDVVVPIIEQSILTDLQEDNYIEHIELTEVFIDEVLFYKDACSNWFDSNLNPIIDPLLIPY